MFKLNESEYHLLAAAENVVYSGDIPIGAVVDGQTHWFSCAPINELSNANSTPTHEAHKKTGRNDGGHDRNVAATPKTTEVI